MLKAVLFALISINIFALEVSLQGAKENHQAYSTFHLKDKDKFLCQEIKNDFDIVEKIVCAFSKSPSKKLQKIQNNFFEITTQVNKKTFFLIIKPFEKIKLYPMIFDLTQDDTVFSSNVELSRHWMIVGYKDKIPYMKENTKTDVSINFPFTFSKDKFPYVGSLDIKGNPVHVERVGDVTEYIKIKQLYKDEKYDFCLELIDQIMYSYPNSLFTAELLFYKIKVHSKLKDYDNVIEVSKTYLSDYSADENVPEVLSLVAKAYFKTGLTTDADYFFDRLFSEHPDSLYTKWGYVYKGEMLISSGSSTNARALFEKAIKTTDNIDVAVEAAYRLAHNLLANVRTKEAAEYIQKIVKAKPEYFFETMDKSMGMMYDFIDNSDFITGSAIAQAILNEINTNYDEYEEMLRDIGIWLSKTPMKQESLTSLNMYLTNFAGGMYEEEVRIAKDSLFFDVSDANITTKLSNYDRLMQEYSGDSIGNKATYEKAKLLIENEQFVDALDLEDRLLTLDKQEYKDVEQLITDAAIGTMKQALDQKECNSVLVISSKYKIDLSDEWDDGVYECAMKGADFTLAQKIADKNLKSKDLQERKKWIYRAIKIDFATGNYSDVLGASKDLISLIQEDKNSPYIDVYRYIFDTYKRLENSDKLIDAIVDIEKVYSQDYLDIDRYVAVMAVGSDKKDSNIVIKYGEKVMNMQKASDSHAQSPFIEFTLYQAYIDKEDNNKALEVIKSLDTIELSNSDRARQKYLQGSVLDKLWRGDDAQIAYQEAINADKDSAWAKLAEGAKEI
ncbi:MAG: flagellar protein [Sulfurimonas sp.]|uniref:tetratricopeptide repeat protein n=1 Tax=Sulfurimonas sp. TaxID=2022749 RepID=UPI00261EC8CA|nr:flagellar protein [Sulfurimonas sp.]MCW8895700.1 flagellar protein [Sulfurimonas sp.]MCW8953700.1 flagellar protein [Sulfurimonas sp.]MCW9068252.1 flagellar protein [Sulfurimonas sp.]